LNCCCNGTPLPGQIPPPFAAVPGLELDGVEASDEEREARESLPGEGKESNHSCGGLGGGGPQEASRSSLGGKASGGIWGLCC
jgi:hypothetical protein